MSPAGSCATESDDPTHRAAPRLVKHRMTCGLAKRTRCSQQEKAPCVLAFLKVCFASRLGANPSPLSEDGMRCGARILERIRKMAWVKVPTAATAVACTACVAAAMALPAADTAADRLAKAVTANMHLSALDITKWDA